MNCWSWASELGLEGEIVFINSQYLMTIVILCVVAYSWNVVCCCWYVLLLLLPHNCGDSCSHWMVQSASLKHLTGSEAHLAFIQWVLGGHS